MKKLKKNEILVLRTCAKNGESYGGFTWPLTVGAVVTAPDWEPTNNCGNGLHGLPWGVGGNYCDVSANVWLVLRVDIASDYIDMGNKCKFKTCIVEGRFDNARDATDMIKQYAPANCIINYSYNSGGDDFRNSGGHHSHNSGGDYSYNFGSDYSHNFGGDYSHNSGGYGSYNSGGNESHNSGGHRSCNSGGYGSHNSGSDYSHNSGGDESHNSGGYGSYNSGGDWSRCNAQNGGFVCLGRNACAAVSWLDGCRERVTVLYSGENGIKPGKWYRLDKNGAPVEIPEKDWAEAMQNDQNAKL